MKKILVIITLLGGLVNFTNKATAQDFIMIEMSRSAYDNKNDYLHKLGNEFAKSVGDTLKAMYPATVQDVDVYLKEEEGGKVTLIYTALIARCEEEEAMYYFDRRGAMTAGNNFAETELDAKNRATQQTIVASENFKKEFGSPYVTKYRRVFISTKYGDFKYLYLAENFIGAGPKKF